MHDKRIGDIPTTPSFPAMQSSPDSRGNPLSWSARGSEPVSPAPNSSTDGSKLQYAVNLINQLQHGSSRLRPNHLIWWIEIQDPFWRVLSHLRFDANARRNGVPFVGNLFEISKREWNVIQHLRQEFGNLRDKDRLLEYLNSRIVGSSQVHTPSPTHLSYPIHEQPSGQAYQFPQSPWHVTSDMPRLSHNVMDDPPTSMLTSRAGHAKSPTGREPVEKRMPKGEAPTGYHWPCPSKNCAREFVRLGHYCKLLIFVLYLFPTSIPELCGSGPQLKIRSDSDPELGNHLKSKHPEHQMLYPDHEPRLAEGDILKSGGKKRASIKISNNQTRSETQQLEPLHHPATSRHTLYEPARSHISNDGWTGRGVSHNPAAQPYTMSSSSSPYSVRTSGTYTESFIPGSIHDAGGYHQAPEQLGHMTQGDPYQGD